MTRMNGVLTSAIQKSQVTAECLSALQEGLLLALAEKGILTPAQHGAAEKLRQAPRERHTAKAADKSEDLP